jgi:hypothetical protein
MLTIQYAKDPVWSTPEQNNAIHLIVKFEEFNEELPFVAASYDPMPYGVQLFNNAIAGEYGSIAPYVVPTPTAEQNKLTATQLLTATDWTSIADVADPAVSNPYLMNQAEFLSYRSQLREIAVNPVAGFITFPTKPVEQWSN